MSASRWTTALSVAALVIGGSPAVLHVDAAGSAPAANPGERSASGGPASALLRRGLAEVAAAVSEAGRPPCGTVHVAVERTPDGRSWGWPQSCRVLLDADVVDGGGAYFRWVARHEVAHLHAGTDHHDGGFRSLESRLASNIGVNLLYGPGAEYPELVERP